MTANNVPAPGGKVGVNTNRSPQIMQQKTVRASPRAAANGSAAPVCPISRSQVPPAMPGIKVPVVPRASDLPSAIAAINAIAAILTEESYRKIRWLEKERVTARVRIFNPEDDSQWVDVIRIMKLVMEDQITGELWVWELERQVAANLGPTISALEFAAAGGAL